MQFMTETTTKFLRPAFSAAFLLWCVITAICLIVPFGPKMPVEGLDPSWRHALNEALAQGMVFGRDIIFTSGPYASIYTTHYHPASDAMMLYGSLLIALSFALVLFLNFKNKSIILILALAVALTGIENIRDTLFFFYVLMVGTYAVVEAVPRSDTRTRTLQYLTLLLLLVPFGLIPLAKGSLLVVCVVATGAAFLASLMRGQWAQAVFVCVVPMVSLVAFWVGAGQPLSYLPTFFLTIVPIISGYTEAMAIKGDMSDYVLYSIASALMIAGILVFSKLPLLQRALLALLFLTILLVVFKASFVRHDGHALIGGAFIVFAALLAAPRESKLAYLPVFAVAIWCWGYIEAEYRQTDVDRFLARMEHVYTGAAARFERRYADPDYLMQSYEAHLDAIKTSSEFPVLEGTSDIYSFDLANLIASGNTWNPRPIFQSYSVYTPSLALKNKAHLEGGTAPDNVFFKVQPLDSRVPSLGDGASWLSFYENYTPTGMAKDYLILERRDTPTDIALTPSETSRHRFGELVEVPKEPGFVFASFDINKSAIGSLISAVFKPSQLEIELHLSDKSVRKYRMIAGMAKSGMVLSPLIASTSDFGISFAGKSFLSDATVEAFKIVPRYGGFIWQPEFGVTFSQFDPPEHAEVAAALSFQPVDLQGNSVLETGALEIAEACTGSLVMTQWINENSRLQRAASSFLEIDGWVTPSLEAGKPADAVFVQISSNDGVSALLPSMPKPREDVAVALRNPNLRETGFAAKTDVSALSGVHKLNIVVKQDGVMKICPALTQEFDPDTKSDGLSVVKRLETDTSFQEAKGCAGDFNNIDLWLAPGGNGDEHPRPMLTVEGWSVLNPESGELAGAIELLIEDADGQKYSVTTRSTYRPDVGNALGNPDLNNSGFSSKADLAGTRESILVRILVEDGGEQKICPGVVRKFDIDAKT